MIKRSVMKYECVYFIHNMANFFSSKMCKKSRAQDAYKVLRSWSDMQTTFLPAILRNAALMITNSSLDGRRMNLLVILHNNSVTSLTALPAVLFDMIKVSPIVYVEWHCCIKS